MHGNCTKPDIIQLDTEWLWAIKCKVIIISIWAWFYIPISVGHVDYRFPVSTDPDADDKEGERILMDRWTKILQKSLNPKCRQMRPKPLSSWSTWHSAWTSFSWSHVAFMGELLLCSNRQVSSACITRTCTVKDSRHAVHRAQCVKYVYMCQWWIISRELYR